MARVPDNQLKDLTEEQQKLAGEISGHMHNAAAIAGPHALLLRIPNLERCVLNMTLTLSKESRLDKKLREIAIMVVARHWSAEYEWVVHAAGAAKAGISAEVIGAIKAYRLPPFQSEGEKLVYEIVTEFLENKRLSQASYDRILSVLGLEKLIELITLVGYYSMIAVIIDAFEISMPSWSNIHNVSRSP